MDATQKICDSILESDEDVETDHARAEPLATLRVLKNKHIPETVLPLYLGENVLGRDPSSCTLPIHAQSVSKQHTAVSISVIHASSRGDCASVEALVWDMGSMNGTRKGRLKLSPHVRYALSDGDNLMVADIPCQYTSCVDPGSVVTRGSSVASESQGSREDVEVHTNGHPEERTRASLGQRGEMMETPARTKVLSFEQTPDQPEGSLVPESDSDSDGERGRKDRWRKTLVSASDSHVTSPTCSTFLSPANKIIPESEDESPVTPSSSSKHQPTRGVSTDHDEQDVGARRQRLVNQKAAQFSPADGKDEEEEEEKEEEVAPEGTEPEKSEVCAADSLANSGSTWAEDGLDQPGPAPPSELIQVLNMDSDTDVEEGEEQSSVSLGPGSPNRPQPAPTPPTANAAAGRLGQLVMDSDTDVDDDDGGVDAPRAAPAATADEANAAESPGEVVVAQQTDGDTDGDMDVEGQEEEDDYDYVFEPGGVSHATHPPPQSENTPVSWAGSAQPSDFHLESDTDVEDEQEEEEEEEEGGEDAVTKSSSAKAEAESRGVVFASAVAPPNFDLDSDTDDEVLVAEVDSAPATPAPAADPGTHLDILSDSDTDVEEDDSPLIPPAVGVAITSGPKSSARPSSSGPVSLAAALGPDSDADTDVEEISSSPMRLEVSTVLADSGMDSDTDLEEEEAGGGRTETEGGPVSCSSDEKDLGSLQGHRAFFQHCSTPVEPSGGAIAEMETQEYLGPSIEPFKCPMVPGLRPPVSLSSSDSQGDDDFVVAETQSFIVAERDQQSGPSRIYTLDETQPFIPQGTPKHEEGLSGSLHLQAKAQALAMEITQSFIQPDVNLEATQAYASPPSLDGSSLELDSELEATQSYLGSAGSSGRSPGPGIQRPVDMALEATQAFIPESHGDTEAGAVDEVDAASAETQPMAFPSGPALAAAETQLPCEWADGGREQVDGVDTPPAASGTDCALSSAATRPAATAGDKESDDEDSVPAPRKRRARRLVEEEDTQVMTGSEPTAAPETLPASSTSSDESTEDEDGRPSLQQIPTRTQRKRRGETGTRATAGGTVPEADSDATRQATAGRPRSGRGRHLSGPGTSRGGREEEEEQEPPASLRSTRSKGNASSSTGGGTGDVRGEEEEEEEEEEAGRRTTRQPRENARENKKRLERERKERSEVARVLKAQEEQEKMEQTLREQKEEEQRMERDRREKEERDREERERLEREREERERLEREREERERLEVEEKERQETERKEREERERLERIQREKEEQERLEQERKEREERVREEQERLERERKELEEKERERKELEEKEKERKELEKERLKRAKKEQERERLRREKDERQQKAKLERAERERWRRAQEEEAERARLETEKRAREELDQQRQSDERDRLMREALERQLLERQQPDTDQARSDQQTPKTTRGRRATKTATTAAPAAPAAPPEPDPDTTDRGPASRTRSRSNSSNSSKSVSSERSASSATVQESGRGPGRGRGRGRVAKKTHPPVAGSGTSAVEGRRRRTVAGDTQAEGVHPSCSTRSRSNSTDSLNSEVSACSGAQSRGGARKTVPASGFNPQPSSSAQSEVAAPPRASARGRRTKGPAAAAAAAAAADDGGGNGEEEPGSQPAGATRGHRRTNAAHPGPSVVGAVEQEGTPPGDSTLVPRSNTGRGKGRRAQVKAEPVVAPAAAVDGTDGVESEGNEGAKGSGELEGEPREKKPAPVRRGRGASAQVKRNPNKPQTQEVLVKEEEEKEEETIPRKVRKGRPSVAKKEKNEEVAAVAAGEGVAPAPHVTERDAGTSKVTQTPAGKSSRKRGAAPALAEASPPAKSPRASLASPRGRLGAACQPHKVLFTGLVDKEGEELVVRLGGSLALGVSDMTHLVTDKVRRTVKFLCAMARGIPVVTPQWLEKSAKAGCFLSPSAFIVKDTEQEQKFNFRLQESIRIASSQPLLQGYRIHVTKSVMPEPVHMSDIISCCGASFLAKMPSSHKEQTVVVSCEEDWPLCGPARAASLPVVSAEFLLTGILQQKADVAAHALPSVPATAIPPRPAAARGRGRRRT